MTPSVSDIVAILPELVIVAGACLVLILDPILHSSKKEWLAWISLGALAMAFIMTASTLNTTRLAFNDLISLDPYSGFFKLLLYVITGLTLLFSLAYLKAERIHLAEYYGFLLLALTGMMVMVSGADLLIIYLGMELMSISLYILAGFKRGESRSLEASAKYFVLGAFSSAILLYGISLLFGIAGSTQLSTIAGVVQNQGLDDPGLVLAMVLLVAGFGFKLSAVPFHMWTPDVYEGAPTSVTAFMAVASKVASFGAFLRVFLEGLAGIKAHWHILFLIICIATLVLGNVVALVQTNIKRMLAYSSIAHAGYALIGVVVASQVEASVEAQTFGVSSVLLYLAVYSFMTMGAFGMIGMLRRGGLEGEDIQDFTGLAKRQPFMGFLMLIFMLSLAGIPPTAGFIGKFYLFLAAVDAGLTWLAVLAVLFSVVGAFYYLRIVMVMYMQDPQPDAGILPKVQLSPVMIVVFACALAGVFVLGLYPDPLVSLTTHAVSPLY